MAKKSKQYSFHLNLDNPDHLKVYRTLEDLNTDIHKSISNFVVKAVVQYINGASRASLTVKGKNEKENLEGYVTRHELETFRLQIKADVMKEVAQLFSNVTANQTAITPELIKQMMELASVKAEQKYSTDTIVMEKERAERVPTDKTLEEMSVIFAQGNFGEE